MPMQELVEYVLAHTDRTACQCGKCLTNGPDRLDGHTADMVFFQVSAKNNPDPEVLKRLLKENMQGHYCNLDMLDNQEHSYMEVGGWIGDQGIAMQLMGLGWLLKLWQCMTPRMIGVPDDLAMQMAGAGFVSLIPHPKGAEIRY